MKFGTIALSLVAATVAWGLSMPAQATTQALALVNSDGPVQLACHGQSCWAEFSSFCLQPERRSPTLDTKYELAGVQDIRLVGERADGRRVVLDAATELEISALRTHVAVRLSLPRARVNELGLERVAVEVGRKVALLPRPTADEAPMSAAEVAAVKTSLRELGTRLVDGNTDRMPAARLVNRMVNALPPGGRVELGVREALWARIRGSAGMTAAPQPAKDIVHQVYDYCADGAKHSLQPSLRRCLQSNHDTLLGKLNGSYWDAVKAGS